ncbi:MAG TPA: ATP-binding protein [Selenomonadales bacterium]|nr:ATP-binding protein [Selenomonadales bacterium]
MVRKTLSLNQKICLLLISVITVPTLLYGYWEASQVQERLLKQEKQLLARIIVTLEQRLPGGFDEILAAEGLSNADEASKRAALNRRLQPVVDEISRRWPGYGIGYYSREFNIVALAPYNADNLGRAAGPHVLEVYATGQAVFSYIKDGFTQGGVPVVAYSHPLFYNGQLIGHAWANSKTSTIENAVWNTILRHIVLLFLMWLAMVAVIRWALGKFRRSLTEMGMQISQGKIQPEKFQEFPELVPILEKVQQLEAKLVQEHEVKERIQDEMARLDRLNLVGEMAAGVAHEIRNPMTVVMGYIQFMSKRADSEWQGNFSVILEELKRVEGIIGDFLSLARNKQVEKEHRDLNDIIRGLYPLIAADCQKRGLTMDLRLAEKLPAACLDAKEMKQLILNLARNGIEAMNKGGKLTIRTGKHRKGICLSLSDTGCGIAPDVLMRIFDPFFTTKAEGTGLGLAVCKSIVHRHGGEIEAQSRVGKGTTFLVTFPPAAEGC